MPAVDQYKQPMRRTRHAHTSQVKSQRAPGQGGSGVACCLQGEGPLMILQCMRAASGALLVHCRCRNTDLHLAACVALASLLQLPGASRIISCSSETKGMMSLICAHDRYGVINTSSHTSHDNSNHQQTVQSNTITAHIITLLIANDFHTKLKQRRIKELVGPCPVQYSLAISSVIRHRNTCGTHHSQS